MTVRELRKKLFVVENQEITIRELRNLLFQADDEMELTNDALLSLERKYNK